MTRIHAIQELLLQTLGELAELISKERSFGELEEAVQRLAGRVTLRLLEWVLAGIDERLMRERDRRRYVYVDARERVARHRSGRPTPGYRSGRWERGPGPRRRGERPGCPSV